MLVWSSTERDFTCMEGLSGVGTAIGICFSPKFSTLYCLITHTWPHTMLVLHWSQPIPTQSLPFIGHSLHPCDLALHWPQSTPMQCLPCTVHALHPCNACYQNCFVDFTNGWMYLSTTSAGFIAGQGDIFPTVLECTILGLTDFVWLLRFLQHKWNFLKQSDYWTVINRTFTFPKQMILVAFAALWPDSNS